MLAKELGVESKLILEKLRSEGLTVPNHQSTVSIGLAETIREWFSGHDSSGHGGTAVETAPPAEALATSVATAEGGAGGGTATATKLRSARARKKKADDESGGIAPPS